MDIDHKYLASYHAIAETYTPAISEFSNTPQMHTLVHMHTQTDTNVHASTHACTHAHTHTHADRYTPGVATSKFGAPTSKKSVGK